MKRVLLIAFHFPPVQGSSGVQRTLRFARYLPDFGWEPIVLTAHPRAYAETSDDQLKDIPPGVRVIRAPAWDSSRHLSIAGRYPPGSTFKCVVALAALEQRLQALRAQGSEDMQDALAALARQEADAAANAASTLPLHNH